MDYISDDDNNNEENREVSEVCNMRSLFVQSLVFVKN